MKVWLRTVVLNDKITYAHIFTGDIVEQYGEPSGYIKIKKSYLEFGDHAKKQNFQKPGQKIFVGEGAQPAEIDKIKHWVIEEILDGTGFNPDMTFRVGRK